MCSFAVDSIHSADEFTYSGCECLNHPSSALIFIAVHVPKLLCCRNKDAKVVVVFVLESTAIKLLDALRGSNLGLIFLASEAWGVSTYTLQDQRGMTARGSLVLTVNSTK